MVPTSPNVFINTQVNSTNLDLSKYQGTSNLRTKRNCLLCVLKTKEVGELLMQNDGKL